MSMEDGIYFGMPEEAYHGVPALGSSGIKDLLVSPLTFWARSPFNPARQDRSTDAKDKGSVFHKRILEGPAVFAEHYAVKPSKDDYPDALDGAQALRERCEELGVKKSGTIGELCARIRDADPSTPLWPEIVASWQAENDDKIAISADAMDEVESRARIVEVHPEVVNAFRGGFPEVSIFWTDDQGIPCKLRVDYLKVRWAIDLKSFSNPMDMSVDEAVGRAMGNYKYHAQGYHYLEGIEAAKALYRERGPEIVHGDAPGTDWLDAFAAPGPHRFAFVFIETGDVPNVRIRELVPSERKGGERNAYWIAAEMAVTRAKEVYRTAMQHYGPDLPWVDPQPMTAFQDTDFPLFALS